MKSYEFISKIIKKIAILKQLISHLLLGLFHLPFFLAQIFTIHHLPLCHNGNIAEVTKESSEQTHFLAFILIIEIKIIFNFPLTTANCTTECETEKSTHRVKVWKRLQHYYVHIISLKNFFSTLHSLSLSLSPSLSFSHSLFVFIFYFVLKFHFFLICF